MANYKSEKRPLTAAERTAKILRDNRNHSFCYPIAKRSDTERTKKIKKAAI
jgi:hypothetical protein